MSTLSIVLLSIGVVFVAYVMAKIQKGQGYNFWRYFFISIIVVVGLVTMVYGWITKNS